MVNTAEKLFSSTLSFIVYDRESIQEAEKRFSSLQADGVIRSDCTFNDSVWYTTDQYQNTGLHFSFSEFSYRRYYTDIFRMPLEDFVCAVKVFIISFFGHSSLSGINDILLDIRHLINQYPGRIDQTSGNSSLKRIHVWEDFIDGLIPDDNAAVETFRNSVECYAYESVTSCQRTLADYDTYFLFDEIIQRYWKEDLSNDERLFYYPVYLWWVLTSVIPQRPREFLLMPRDCLSMSNGKYCVTFRRDTNKGYGAGRNYFYTIDEAYRTDTYPVPDHIGKEIENYLHLTADFRQTDINTLLVTTPHYSRWGIRNKKNSRFFTYSNFVTALHYFYDEVIAGRYGYHVIRYKETDTHLDDGEIGIIHPGDTRHIALINLMQSGGTPFLGMLFAGHADSDMASHYYSNITSFIRCRTFRQYRRYIGQQAEYTISSFTAPLTAKGYSRDSVALTDGRCSSENYRNHDYSDCLAAAGPNGEIGDCRSCHFRSDPDGTVHEDVYQANIRADCEALADAVNLVRQNKGYPEDIGEVINRLRGTTASYGEFLMYKYEQEKDGE